MIRARLLVISVIFSMTVPLFSGDVVSSKLEAEIIAKISAKALLMYTKYAGVECKKEIVSRQYDYRDNTDLGTYTVLFDRKEYYYKKAKNRIITYIKNGKEEPAWKYNFPNSMPPYHPFARNSEKNYTIRLIGKKNIDGVPCWELDVIPKKKTQRHLMGRIYFTCASLDLFYLKATFAKNPLGVKEIEVEIFFKKLDDARVASRGTYIFRINLPLIYPHTKFVQEYTYSEVRLIPAKTGSKPEARGNDHTAEKEYGL